MWTYSGNPAHSAVDAVRFLIGDTNHCDQLLQDGEIAWVLGQYNNVPMNAAIRCCEVVMSKFSRMCDETVGQVSLSYSQKAKAYRDMRGDLVRRLATEDMTPFAGGISIAADQANINNNDRVKPDFTKHMMENQQIAPWVSQGLKDFLDNGQDD
jgi:hypothetical protein